MRHLVSAEGRASAHPVRDALRARARADAVVLSALLEITKRCNLHCYHCYVCGDADELPTTRWTELLEELAAEGCIRVTLTGGEVAMREDWLTIAEAVRRNGMVLSVLTNGTLFTKDELDQLAGLHPLRVAVSIYGATAAAHDRVTKVSGSFDRSIQTLRVLRAHQVRCRVSCTLMPDTLPQVPAIVELAEGLGCEPLFDPSVAPRVDGDLSVLRYRVSAEDVGEWLAQRGLIQVSHAGEPTSRPSQTPGRRAGNCDAGMTSVYVDAGGQAFPCMGLMPAFGSITRAPFRQVWRSRTAEQHRELMNRPLPDCVGCKMQSVCGVRCARLAQVEDGSLTSRSSRACEIMSVVSRLSSGVAECGPR